MNKFYLVGVFGNRVLAVVTILALTFLLNPSEFGVFSLTATNVLVTNVLLSWWISSATYKFLVSDDPEVVQKYTSNMAFCTIAAIILSVLTLVFMGLHYEFDVLQIVLLCIWAVTLLLFDITLAANNALGRAQSYASFALLRNTTVLAVTMVCVWAGWGVTGAMVGQAIGTLVPFLLFPSASRFWTVAQSSKISIAAIKEMFVFGVAGALALGLYMLTQGFARNAMEARIDAAAAGQFALALDLLNAPLMLFGAAFSLSRMRALYQTHAAGDHQATLVETRRFMETYLLFGIPYTVAGTIVAPDLIALVVGPDMVAGVKSIAQAAVVQAGAIQILSAFVTGMLVFNYRKRVIASIILIASANFLAVWLMPSTSLESLAWASTAVISAFALVGIAIGIFGKTKVIDVVALTKILFATALCAAACWSWFHLLPFHDPISATVAGLIVFVVTARKAGILEWNNLWERPAG